VILIFGVLASFESIRMGPWKDGVPGPGLFPLVGAGGITVLAALLLATSTAVSSGQRESFLPQNEELRQLGAFALSLLLLPFLARILGFVPSSSLFLALLFRYPGGYGWKTSLVVSIVTVGILYVALVVVLGADLPQGPLGV
jgi:hypothetical protein